MPKFAANLSMLFTDVPFLDRFKAAADAGFTSVEYLFPYEYPAPLLAEKLRENGLKQVLFNTAPGNIAAGEWGVSALPDRIEDARRDIDNALEYALALNCPSVLVMGASCRPVKTALPISKPLSITCATPPINLHHTASTS